MPDSNRSAAASRIGVIDVGSNSLRLVVFERLGAALFPLVNEKVMCGLGRGIASTGRLNPDGVALALVNLRRFVAFARAIAVDHLAVLATAAVRDARDGAAFAAEVERAVRRPGQDHRRRRRGPPLGGRACSPGSRCGWDRRRSRRRQRRAGAGRWRPMTAGESARVSACRSARCASPNSATAARRVIETIEAGARRRAGVARMRRPGSFTWSAARRARSPGCTWSTPAIRSTSSTSTRSRGARPKAFSRSSAGSPANRWSGSPASRGSRLEVVPLAAFVLRKLIAAGATATGSSFPPSGCARAMPMACCRARTALDPLIAALSTVGAPPEPLRASTAIGCSNGRRRSSRGSKRPGAGSSGRLLAQRSGLERAPRLPRRAGLPAQPDDAVRRRSPTPTASSSRRRCTPAMAAPPTTRSRPRPCRCSTTRPPQEARTLGLALRLAYTLCARHDRAA